MAGFALAGSKISSSQKDGYVTYTWTYTTGFGEDERDRTGSGSTYAEVTGYIDTSIDHGIYVNGVAVALAGDPTIESWSAGEIRTTGRNVRNVRVSPGRSGTGTGMVGDSGSNVKVNNVSVALIGTNVDTSIGSTSVIEEGTEKVNDINVP